MVEIHIANPTISARYSNSDIDKVKHGAATFFIAGTGGPSVYEGKNMLETHRGMNISGAEFLAVLEDAVAALDKNGIGQREKEEVLYVPFSIKGGGFQGLKSEILDQAKSLSYLFWMCGYSADPLCGALPAAHCDGKVRSAELSKEPNICELSFNPSELPGTCPETTSAMD